MPNSALIEDQLKPTLFTAGTTLGVDGGRVTTLELDTTQEIASITILGTPAHGTVTINPDNSMALVLSGSNYSGALSFDYEVTFSDGTSSIETATLDVAKPEQDAGWGQGKHYMLEVDDQGDLIVETGENHRKVYVSGSNDALTRVDIAALEGLSESDITGQWLLDNPEYGGSEGEALASDLGMELWFALNPIWSEPASNWLLFEKGYTYEGMGGGSNERLISGRVSGESPLHPIYITSWGTGERPVIADKVEIFQYDSKNIVFNDLAFKGGIINLSGDNVIVNDSSFTKEGLNIQGSSGFTLRDSDVSYVVNDKPVADFWTGTKAGLFAKETPGLLVEGTVFHHNGWEDDYRMDGSTDGGMPPSAFSHNVYLQNTTSDVTFRDNISSQAASFGAHIRGGGFVEDNVFLDNNVGVDLLGGVYQGDGPIGNFTFFADNLITSGGHKDSKGVLPIGARSAGLMDKGYATTFLDNIIAHLADPDNPQEKADKFRTDQSFTSENGTAYEDTIIYNWEGGGYIGSATITDKYDQLDTALADQTTIQKFAAAVLNQDTASISELMDAILGGAAEVTADDIIAYFQAGFGVTASGDGSAIEHRFIPNALAGGFRWDNRINWDHEELPDAGDSVDLGGNSVQYGGTTQLLDLDLGIGGKLFVNSGKLAVDGTFSVGEGGGAVEIVNAGQFWINGYADNNQLSVDVNGGRFANTGDVTGNTLLRASDGQTILAAGDASYTLTTGSKLIIEGTSAQVGFDGAVAGERAVLTMEEGSFLKFVSDATGFGTIEEFRSGRWDNNASQVTSVVSLDGTLTIDLSDYTGGVATFVLIEADQLTGQVDNLEIIGLDAGFDVMVATKYEADRLKLTITEGTGQAELKTVGTFDADVMIGTLGDDIQFGKLGADILKAGAGNDIVKGNRNKDSLFGEEGNDMLFGGKGGDSLFGGRGDDTLFGGKGNDRLQGGNGRDRLDGGVGDDTMLGGNGDDRFVFSAGNDLIIDFNAASNREKIDLSDVASINSFQELTQNYLSEAVLSGYAVIDDGSGNTLTLNGVSIGDLDQGDFIF